MGYRIEVVVDECMSSGKCISDFPEAFTFDDDELASLVDGATALSDHHMVRAARNCPSQALQVFDEQGEQVST